MTRQYESLSPMHWDILNHLRARHPSREENVLDGRELQEFREKMKITPDEETRLGIPDDRQGFHVVNLSVRHENPLHLPSICDVRGEFPTSRRTRREVLTPMPFYVEPI